MISRRFKYKLTTIFIPYRLCVQTSVSILMIQYTAKVNTLLFARSILTRFLRIYFNIVTHFYPELHFYQVMQPVRHTLMDYEIFCNPRIRTSLLCHSIRFNIMLSCRPMFSELYFCFGCPSKKKTCRYASFHPHSCYIPRPLHYFLLITIVCTEDYVRHKASHYLIFFRSSVVISLLVSDVCLSTKFSNILRLCFTPTSTNQVLDPYNTTEKYLVSYILILICLDSKQERRNILYRTVGGKHYMNLICT